MQPDNHANPLDPFLHSVLDHSASNHSPKDTPIAILLRVWRMYFKNPSLYTNKSTTALSQLLWSDKLHLSVTELLALLSWNWVPNKTPVELKVIAHVNCIKYCSNLGRQITAVFSASFQPSQNMYICTGSWIVLPLEKQCKSWEFSKYCWNLKCWFLC